MNDHKISTALERSLMEGDCTHNPEDCNTNIGNKLCRLHITNAT